MAARLPGDADGDEVLDAEDACPGVPGSLEDEGCPDGTGTEFQTTWMRPPMSLARQKPTGAPDTDGDGVADDEDLAPEESGAPEGGGAPESGAGRPRRRWSGR